ncbi:MAG: flagellar biosynthesis regulator FlaF [Marinicaulis sp.]|nr:flagellar biosynthesis regulator FlaF [Marinicaulis sp.]NNE41849.1 flagellar biosynthesis regulator FlaF [Marinicaulis sp.]NNL90297.1 flagellar biosynthesis regulator FlaF [Marinicaulis sp.]
MIIDSQLALKSYDNSNKSTGTDRATEYRALANVTRDLANADPSMLDYSSKLATALHRNMKLWTVLATDVADNENLLAPQIRSKLFYLAEFVRLHTSKIHAREADPQILIDINKNLMRGLRENSKTERTSA